MFVPISRIALKHNHKKDWTPLFPSNVVIYKHIPISQNTHSEYRMPQYLSSHVNYCIYLSPLWIPTSVRYSQELIWILWRSMRLWMYLTKTCAALLN